MLHSGWNNEGQHFFLRIYMSFYSFVLCETDVGRKDRLLYWPITSSLDHSTLCYLQDPLSTSSASQAGLLNLSDCKLGLTLTFTVSNWFNCRGHLHILFHNSYLHRCISDWQLGQGSLCNIRISFKATISLCRWVNEKNNEQCSLHQTEVFGWLS